MAAGKRTDTTEETPGGIQHTMTFADRTTFAVKQIARVLADTLIPPACLACHQPLATHDTICAKCWSNVTFIRPPICDSLGIPLPFDPGNSDGQPLFSAAALARPRSYDRARATAIFSGVMRDLIHALKYGDRHDARYLFGRWLLQTAGDLLEDANLIIPVPLHPRRLFSRRFNQSAILALELSKLAGRPYEPLILHRRTNTISQVGLSREQRRKNLQGAFAVPPTVANRILGKNVLLVDDVITTGTTVEACARVLKKAGAARVDVAALAIVADDHQISP